MANKKRSKRKNKLLALLRSAKETACRAAKATQAHLPLINCLLVLLVLVNQSDLDDKLTWLREATELHIGLTFQDFAIDRTHFIEFMKRFGGEDQGS